MTAPTINDLYGVPVPLIAPGSPEWLQVVSASKVAAVLGLSPYESRFSLYHRMRGTVPAEADTDLTRRGHYLEPAIRAWFADEHPDWTVQTTGSWRHPQRTWQTASPDWLVLLGDGVIEGFEAKSAIGDEEWGEDGSDQVPPGVRAQVLWQMDTIGTRRTHVAVLTAFLEFRSYVIDYDADEAAAIVASCDAFLTDVRDGRQPDIDAHNQTYVTLRELHPDIDDVKVELPMRIADGYRGALEACKEAEAAKRLATSLVADVMGTARRAHDPLGEPVAIRVPGRGDNPPFIRPARTGSPS